MKQKTRDNLIYLALSVGVITLILADFFYADSHGERMWWPSKFASRGVYTTILLAYVVARETRKLKATLVEVMAYVLLASVAHLTIVFAFHKTVNQLSGIAFSALAILEMFLVFQLLMAAFNILSKGAPK